ncbi:MAG TPA: DUF4328 domain-containing protein [Mesorhizobium sp.]|jgi:hypothetical protein|nr:DUF4328 domain-containing protein [Mesorhizobium sp.]
MRAYRRFAVLTALLVVLLKLSLVADFATLFASVIDYLVINRIRLGSGDFVLVADPARVEEVWGVLAIAQLAAHILVIAFTFFWIMQANRSARALGTTDFTYSPLASVGWYFVPVWNFWKPVHAMAEIWSASLRGTAEWRMEELPRAFAVWWPLFIIVNTTGRSAARHILPAQDPSAIVVANKITLLSDGLSILLTMAFLWIVRDIQRGQRARFAALPAPRPEPVYVAEEAPEPDPQPPVPVGQFAPA